MVRRLLNFGGDLFWLAVVVTVGLIVAIAILNFVRKRFGGNLVGRVAGGVESRMVPS